MESHEASHVNFYLRIGILLALIVGGLLLLVLTLYKLAPLVVLILVAIVITTGIDPLVNRLQSATARWWRMPRGIAVLLVLLAGLLILSSALSFLVMTAIKQATAFVQNEELRTSLFNWAVGIARRYHLASDPAALFERLKAQSGQIVGYLWQTTSTLFGLIGGVFSAFIVLTLSFFFTTFKAGITYTLAQFIPGPHQQRVREIAHQAAEKMGGWLRGQFMLAFIITLLSALIMTIVGYPEYAVLVGIIGGIGELIPMVGPYLACIPAVAIVLVVGGSIPQVIIILLLFIVLSQVENYLLSPKIMERQVGLHPITTILALFIGGSLLGIIGALLAIPLAAGGRIVLLEAVFPALQGKSRREIEEHRPEALAAAAAHTAPQKASEDVGDAVQAAGAKPEKTARRKKRLPSS